jgi:RNA polymerase sigma factor (sigma-70 family)
MAESFQATGSQVDLQAATLAQLVRIPLESRYASILRAGRNDLSATLQRLRDEGAPVPIGLDAERLAWAVAFNIEGPSNSSTVANSGSRRGAQGYVDRWPLDTPWNVIWSTLAAPTESRSPESGRPAAVTLLAELALSVACEQRKDWQNPGSRPIEIEEVNRAFEFVYARDQSKVLGDVYSRFGSRAGSPELIAQEAWSRVFCDYWSSGAQRRFLGTSRISTLVCQVARYVAYDTFRGGDARPMTQIESLIDVLGIEIDPLREVLADELRRHIRQCTSHLPAKQEVVATMVWFREIPAKRAAEALQVSEPAVSQLLKKALKAVRNCLRCQGFRCADED